MNTKHLKAKILDLAIRGKLVPQDPSEGNAADLLKKIREEKSILIEQKKIKADKNSSFIIKAEDGRHYEQFADGSLIDIEDDIPFEIPENWCWCRLPQLCRAPITDGTHNSPVNTPKGDYLYITAKNIKLKGIDLSDVTYVTSEIHKQIFSRCAPEKNDVLLTKDGTIGEVTVNNLDYPFSMLSSIALIKPHNYVLPWYITFILKSEPLQKKMKGDSKGSALRRIVLAQINTLLVPLPPIQEQQRIVAAIEKAFEQIDIIEKNKLSLKTYIKQTKSKVLDLAIHGKLVKQNPSEGNAFELLEKIRNEKIELVKQKKLKEDKKSSFIIKAEDGKHYEQFADGTLKDIEDEIPFEEPINWTWCRFNNISKVMLDGDWIESKDQSPSGIRLIQTGNVGNGVFKDKPSTYKFISEKTFNDLNCTEIFSGDILISRLPEPVGKTCIIPDSPFRMITAVDCTIVRLNEEIINKKYFSYYTQSLLYFELVKEHCSGSTRLRISKDNLKTVLFLIPPLSEQQRIVDAIEEIFVQLDILEKSSGD